MRSDNPPDESTPLLNDQTVEAQIPPVTPLPKAQLTALCTVRIIEPIAFTQLFPYVNEFISDLHLTDDPSRVGFYSGLVESVFAIAQLVSIYQWARLSEIIGRRPVILVGVLAIAITTIIFGLSKSLASILISRCIGGLASGNIAVIHSTLGEITDATNQAAAVPLYGLTYPLGSIIGPLIGGSFSHPADKYPQLFNSEFWREYPYFLPCFIASIIAVIGITLGYVFLEETLPRKRRRNGEKPPCAQNTDAPVRTEPEIPMGLRQLLSLPIIRALAMSGFALTFFATAFDVVFVLFCYSPVHTGGLAFSASQIGYSLAASGAMSVAFQVFIMSYLLRTFDCAKMYNFCMGLWPFTFIALPILNTIARNGVHIESGQLNVYATATIWVGVAIVLALSRIAGLAYSLSMILVKDNAPSPGCLAQSNGIVQLAMCASRAVAPFLVSSLFALSVDNNLLGGHMWAVITASLAFYSSTISRTISRHSKRTVA